MGRPWWFTSDVDLEERVGLAEPSSWAGVGREAVDVIVVRVKVLRCGLINVALEGIRLNVRAIVVAVAEVSGCVVALDACCDQWMEV